MKRIRFTDIVLAVLAVGTILFIRIHESRKKREGRDKEAPDEADLDTEADPNEPENYEEDKKSSGGEG